MLLVVARVFWVVARRLLGVRVVARVLLGGLLGCSGWLLGCC